MIDYEVKWWFSFSRFLTDVAENIVNCGMWQHRTPPILYRRTHDWYFTLKTSHTADFHKIDTTRAWHQVWCWIFSYSNFEFLRNLFRNFKQQDSNPQPIKTSFISFKMRQTFWEKKKYKFYRFLVCMLVWKFIPDAKHISPSRKWLQTTIRYHRMSWRWWWKELLV